MANTPSRDYLEQRITQIKAACDACNGALAVAILELIRADGYPEAADAIMHEFVELGLRNMAAAVTR